MKQSMVEKFLWALYNFGETAQEILYVPHTFNQVFYSDYSEICRNIDKKIGRRQFAKFIDYLKRRGYLKIKAAKGQKAILLTQKGFKKIFDSGFKCVNLKKRKDRKWQMIIFDIPEVHRVTRNRFRAVLKLLGYEQLQKSVWISPFDVSKETEELIKLYKLEDYVKRFLIENI